jgi:hypothetical protein
MSEGLATSLPVLCDKILGKVKSIDAMIDHRLDRMENLRRKKTAVLSKCKWSEEVKERARSTHLVVKPTLSGNSRECPQREKTSISDIRAPMTATVSTKQSISGSAKFMRRVEHALHLPNSDDSNASINDDFPILTTTKYFAAPMLILNPVVGLSSIKPFIGDKGLSEIEMRDAMELHCPHLKDGPPHLNCSQIVSTIRSPHNAMQIWWCQESAMPESKMNSHRFSHSASLDKINSLRFFLYLQAEYF